MDLSINKVSLILKKIGTKNYDRKEDSFDLIISLYANGKEEVISKRYRFGKSEDMAADFMKLIKSKFVNSDLSDDTLSHNIIVIERFEEMEEKMLNFVKRINDKIKDFKNYKTSVSYFEMNNVMNSLSFNF